MSKIQELKDEIERLEKENKESLKSKYQYLVGKCIHRAHTSYEKVTNICSVDISKRGDDITYDCIRIYFDNRGDDYNSDASISLDVYGTIESEDIEIYLISQEKFNEAFSACIELFKNRINA